MAALTARRDTEVLAGAPLPPKQGFKQKGGTTVWAGSLVALNAGFAAPGATATGRIATGRACATTVNAGADGSNGYIQVEPGVFRWGNSSAGDAIADADIGKVCYIVDDQTVAKTDGTGTRSAAGIIYRVDSLGVWVITGLGVNA